MDIICSFKSEFLILVSFYSAGRAFLRKMTLRTIYCFAVCFLL